MPLYLKAASKFKSHLQCRHEDMIHTESGNPTDFLSMIPAFPSIVHFFKKAGIAQKTASESQFLIKFLSATRNFLFWSPSQPPNYTHSHAVAE